MPWGSKQSMNASASSSNPIFPSSAQLQPVLRLHRRGLHLQAHAAALQVGSLLAWRSTAARLLAGQLASQLGAPKLAAWHWVHAYREQPEDAETRIVYLRRVLNTRGAL